MYLWNNNKTPIVLFSVVQKEKKRTSNEIKNKKGKRFLEVDSKIFFSFCFIVIFIFYFHL